MKDQNSITAGVIVINPTSQPEVLKGYHRVTLPLLNDYVLLFVFSYLSIYSDLPTISEVFIHFLCHHPQRFIQTDITIDTGYGPGV